MQLHSECVSVDSIVVPKGRRTHAESHVAALAESIAAVGLMNPVTITRDYRLVAGLGRIEAHKRLGRKTIDCRMLTAEGIAAEIAELDENLCRNNLTAVEEAVAIARRKELYEAEHPETKAGGKLNAEPADTARHSGEVEEPAAFSQDTARKTGRSRRTVERAARTGAGLTPAVIPIVAGTAIENRKGELEELAKLPPDKQVEVATRIRSGDVSRVKDALEPSKADELKDGAGNVIPESLAPRWRKAKVLDSLAREVTALKKRIKAVADDPEIGGWLDFPVIEKEFENVQRELKFAKPYTVDRICGGAGCARCRGTGWLVDSPAARGEARAA